MLAYGLAVFALVALIVAVGVFSVLLIGLETALTRAKQRLNRLRALNTEALRLAAARGRFRRGQQRFERVIDTSTARVESAHRSLTGAEYRGTAFYDGLRHINRYLGRGVSNWLAPRATIRRRESAADWRARRRRDDDRD